jgi:Ca2+-binding EF-hand superfamily protein
VDAYQCPDPLCLNLAAQAFRAAGMSYDSKTVGDVFDKADTDRSGTIDFAEFLKLSDILSGRVQAQAAPPPRDNAQTAALRKAFNKYDDDGSGSITKLELAQVRTSPAPTEAGPFVLHHCLLAGVCGGVAWLRINALVPSV